MLCEGCYSLLWADVATSPTKDTLHVPGPAHPGIISQSRVSRANVLTYPNSSFSSYCHSNSSHHPRVGFRGLKLLGDSLYFGASHPTHVPSPLFGGPLILVALSLHAGLRYTQSPGPSFHVDWDKAGRPGVHKTYTPSCADRSPTPNRWTDSLLVLPAAPAGPAPCTHQVHHLPLPEQRLLLPFWDLRGARRRPQLQKQEQQEAEQPRRGDRGGAVEAHGARRPRDVRSKSRTWRPRAGT